MHQPLPIIHDYAEARRPARVVVLGAGGFLGRHLVQQLSDAGIETVAPSSGQLDLSAPSAAADLAELLKPTDAVVILAATKLGLRLDHDGFVKNVAMGAAVCNAVTKIGASHLVYLSSDAVYPFISMPFTSTAIREDSLTAPVSLYSLMHLARETMLQHLDGPPLAILRVAQVYGAGDPHGAYGPRRMVRSALSEGRIVLYGAGQETRDHIHVSDVTSVMSGVLLRRSHGILNIATGRSTAFADLAELVARGCGAQVRIEHEPPRMPVLHRGFDTSALRAAFPERSQTSLEEGIARMIDQERRSDGAVAVPQQPGSSAGSEQGRQVAGSAAQHDRQAASFSARASATDRSR